METLNFTQNAPVSTLNKVATHPTIPGLINTYQSHSEKPDTVSGKKSGSMSIGSYLVDALAEGVKQNLLGSDINMEFLLLSIRVYLIQLSRFAVSYQKNLAKTEYSERRASYQLSKNAGHLLFN